MIPVLRFHIMGSEFCWKTVFWWNTSKKGVGLCVGFCKLMFSLPKDCVYYEILELTEAIINPKTMTSADEQLSECREVFCYFDSKVCGLRNHLISLFSVIKFIYSGRWTNRSGTSWWCSSCTWTKPNRSWDPEMLLTLDWSRYSCWEFVYLTFASFILFARERKKERGNIYVSYSTLLHAKEKVI